MGLGTVARWSFYFPSGLPSEFIPLDPLETDKHFRLEVWNRVLRKHWVVFMYLHSFCHSISLPLCWFDLPARMNAKTLWV